jgi:hypothetical protein
MNMKNQQKRLAVGVKNQLFESAIADASAQLETQQ